MPSYNLNVLSLDVSFKTEADHVRVHRAKALVEERFERLSRTGTKLSKEKLLIYLALSLADDFLQSSEQIARNEGKLQKLVSKIEQV